MSWDRRFDEPIILPSGKALATLRDAGNYISRLPPAEHAAERWQVATEMLLAAAERGVPPQPAKGDIARVNKA